MMPVVAGARSTCVQIVLYTVLLMAASTLPLFLHMGGPVYAAIALPVGGILVALALRLQSSQSQPQLFERHARHLFGFSLLYLALLFAALLIERALAGVL